MIARLRAASVVAVVLVNGACGGPSQSSAPSTAATTVQDTRAVDARLQGRWRLADYRPDVPLEPMFQLMLSTQMQSMVVTFVTGRLRAESPTLHVDRAYQVTDAAGPFFKVISPDYGGGTLVTSCQLSDDGSRIVFHSETEPWIGSGTLQRLP